MKIAMYCRVHENHGPGGMQYIACSIAKGLANKGHEIHYFTTSLDGHSKIEYFNNLFFHYIECEPKKYSNEYFDNSFKLFQQIGNFDIVYSHSSAARRHTQGKIPIIAHWHGIGTQQDQINRKKLGLSYKQHITYFDQNILLFNYHIGCPHEIDLLINNGANPDHCFKTFNGVDSSIFKPIGIEERAILRNKWNISNNDFIIGIAGREASDKGHKQLINILPNLPPDIKILWAGKNVFDRLDRVMCLGILPNNQIVEFYTIIDIFANTTIRNQGFDTVNMEASCCGTSLLLSNVDGHKTIFENDAYIFELANAQDLTEKILLIYNNRPNIIRPIYRKEFTSQYVYEELEKILVGLL